jgi:hypothetical protein
MENNRKLLIVLAIGAILFACCVIVLLLVAFLLPVIRERGSETFTNQPPVQVTTMVEPLTSPPVVTAPVSEAQTQAPPSEQPATQAPSVTEAPPQVSYEGINFSLVPGIAQSVTPGSIPAAPGDPANSFPGDVHPAYLEFAFNDYVLSDTFHDPKIMVYPAKDYGAMDPSVAQIILKLEQLLQDKPSNVESLPFLPIFNAGQFMQANIKYLDFQNGSGVRFLTQYGQAAWPINNKDMFYTFQGLTSDGNWYIAAILPVSHPSLPNDDQTVPGGDIEAFDQNFPNYLAQVETQLSTQPDDSFTPSLVILDALIQSLQAK